MSKTSLTRTKNESNFVMSLHFSNPYAEPPDEDIFSFKQEQRKERAELREMQKTKNIYEKSKHVREGRIKELLKTANDEITLDNEESNSKPKLDKILTQKRIVNKFSRHNLINKNKEIMFLQMLIDTKNNEIEKLNEYKELREDGLKYSEKLMVQQKEKFIKYKDQKKDECLKLAEEGENLSKYKNQIITKLKELSDLESNLSNEIGKTIEKVSSCIKYKEFLECVKHRKYFDENIVQSNKSNSTETNLPSCPGKKKKEEDNLFPPNIQKIINDNTNKYEVGYKSVEDFHIVLEDLEEQNIFLVQRTNLLEQQLEEEKKKMSKNKSNLSNNLSNLTSLRDSILQQSTNLQESCCKTLSFANSNFGFNEEFDAYNDLKTKINWIYDIFKPPGDSKTNVIQQMTMIEQLIYNRLSKIKELESIDNGNFSQMLRKIERKNEKLRRYLKKTKEMKIISDAKIEKEKQRKLKKAQRFSMKHLGRKLIYRSDPLIKKIIKEDKVEVNQEEEEYKRYFE